VGVGGKKKAERVGAQRELKAHVRDDRLFLRFYPPQACEKLYSQRRWLLSGTPFGASVMELRSQCQFLQIQHMGHEFFDSSLKKFMIDQATLERQQQQHNQRRGGHAYRRQQAQGLGMAAAAMSSDDDSDTDSDREDDAYTTAADRARRLKRVLRSRSFDEAVSAMESPADTSRIHERTVVPVEKRRKYGVANTIFTMVCKNMMRHVRDQPYLGRPALYDLPVKTSQIVQVPLTDAQKALYAKMLSIAQTRYRELKRRGLATRKALEVGGTCACALASGASLRSLRLSHFPLPPRERLANSLALPFNPTSSPRKLCLSAARAARIPEAGEVERSQ
jgi:SNF2 family DNA or RNA helicase